MGPVTSLQTFEWARCIAMPVFNSPLELCFLEVGSDFEPFSFQKKQGHVTKQVWHGTMPLSRFGKWLLAKRDRSSASGFLILAKEALAKDGVKQKHKPRSYK